MDGALLDVTRSASTTTVVVVEGLVSPGLMSVAAEVRVAWLTSWAPPAIVAPTFTTMVIAAWALIARSPSSQVTMPSDSVQPLPCEGVAET